MDGRFAEAASAYRAAIAYARLPVHKNAAQMLFARALAKAGQKARANRVYRSVDVAWSGVFREPLQGRR